MGWLATTCWSATAHGKDRQRIDERSAANAETSGGLGSTPSGAKGRGAATPEPTRRNRPSTEGGGGRVRSHSSLDVTAASKGAVGATNNASTKLPAIGTAASAVAATKGGPAATATPTKGGAEKKVTFGASGGENLATDGQQSTSVMGLSPISRGKAGAATNTNSCRQHEGGPDSLSGSNNNSPTKVRTIPPPSMIVWANERNYSNCLKTAGDENGGESARKKFFVADNGPFARSDTRGEMQRVQCMELCAEKRLVDYKHDEAAREEQIKRQVGARMDKIKHTATEHSAVMAKNLKQHSVAQAEKRAALEKTIWRKNRRQLPAIERCDGEEEERALQAASFMTIIAGMQRFSQFFLALQQERMLKVLRRLLLPMLRLRTARKMRVAKAYASVMLKRNPRPTNRELERYLPALQEWPLSQVQLLQKRIRPFYVPRGHALCHEGEPITFLFILTHGKLSATQSASRFKAATGGDDGGFGMGGDFGGGGGGRRGGPRGLGTVGASSSEFDGVHHHPVGRGGKGSIPKANTDISLGERAMGFVVGEELVDIKNETNVAAFAAEDAAIFGDDAEMGDAASVSEMPKKDAKTPRGGADAATGDDDDIPQLLPKSRYIFRREQKRDDKLAAAAEDAKVAHEGWDIPGSGTVEAKVINGVEEVLPFPLVLPSYKGGPRRAVRSELRKRATFVPCFHGRHTCTLRGSAAGNGCYGWYITVDQLSELVSTSAALNEAGLGEVAETATDNGDGQSESRAQTPQTTGLSSAMKSPAMQKLGLLSATLAATATRGTPMERISHHQLRENRVFELLEPNEAQALIPNATAVNYLRGQCIYKYNDPETDVYVVAKGVVEIKTRAANPRHPFHTYWLQLKGLSPDGRPAHHGGGASAVSRKFNLPTGGGGCNNANSSTDRSSSPTRGGENTRDGPNLDTDRALPETRFINVGYCFGDEDAIFSTWRSETAVAATDCVLLRFKAFDLISALTSKTVRFTQLKAAYNDDRMKRYVVPPTPQVITAMLMKGDGYLQMIEAAIGKDPQYRQLNKAPLGSAAVGAVATAGGGNYGGGNFGANNNAFGGGFNNNTSFSPQQQDGANNTSQAGPVVTTNPAFPSAASWPFMFLVGGGRGVDEPTNAELLQELLSGKGAQAPGAKPSANVSAFTLGGLDLRRTHTMMQHFVTVTLARASLYHLCAVINPESLRMIINKYSAIVLDGMGVAGVLDTPAAVAQIAAAKAKNGGGGGVAATSPTTDEATTPKKSSKKAPVVPRKGGIAASLSLYGVSDKPQSDQTPRKAKSIAAAAAAAGGPNGYTPLANPSIIVQHPSLFSTFFASSMRCGVVSPNAQLPIRSSIIYLQQGVVEISAESVAIGPGGRLLFGGGVGGGGGSGNPSSFTTNFTPIRREIITVAAPAIIISGTAFKHAKEQLLKCLYNGTIELAADAGKDMPMMRPPPIVRTITPDNGLPAETQVTAQMLMEEGLRTGLLQDVEGRYPNGKVTDTTNSNGGGGTGKSSRHGGGNAAGTIGDGTTTSSKQHGKGTDKSKDNAAKDGTSKGEGGGKGDKGDPNTKGERDGPQPIVSRLPMAPSIVFKYAVSNAAQIDIYAAQPEVGAPSAVGAHSAMDGGGGADLHREGDNFSPSTTAFAHGGSAPPPIALGGGGGGGANGTYTAASVRRLEQVKHYEMISEASAELAAFAEEVGRDAGGQKCTARTRCTYWHVFHIDAIRRFHRFNPTDVLRASVAAAAHTTAAINSIASGITNFTHVSQDVVDCMPERALGAESELPDLVNKSGVYIMR